MPILEPNAEVDPTKFAAKIVDLLVFKGVINNIEGDKLIVESSFNKPEESKVVDN